MRHDQGKNTPPIFAIHGGGNIGLGLMAAVVSKSTQAYRIIATSNNLFIRDTVNETKAVWLQHPNSEYTQIKGITIIPRETSDLVELYRDATIAAICLTPVAMADAALAVAMGLIERYKTQNDARLQILVLMNIPQCDIFVSEKITAAVLGLTGDEELTRKIFSVIQFIPTVVDRIVTPISNELISDAKKPGLRIPLFNAEKNFSMYVPSYFRDAKNFPLMTVTSDLEQVEAIKNKYINGPHAILAWLGALRGHTTIDSAIADPIIASFIDRMMRDEIAPILLAHYPELSIHELDILQATFLERCQASTDDSVIRVGRDPLRKLNAGGRIRGTLELGKLHNLQNTPLLELGIASGILYALKMDPTNPGCQKMAEIFKNNNGAYYSLLEYTGPAPSGEFKGLDPNEDQHLIDRILWGISWLEKRCKVTVAPGALRTHRKINANAEQWEIKSGIERPIYSVHNDIHSLWQRNNSTPKKVVLCKVNKAPTTNVGELAIRRKSYA